MAELSNCSGGIQLPGECPSPQQRRAPNLSSLFRSQSVHSLPPSEMEESRRTSTKLSIPTSGRKLSSDKTPVTHFCTPRRRSSNLNSSSLNRSCNGTVRRLIDPPGYLSSSQGATPLAMPLQRQPSEANLLPPHSTPSAHVALTPDCYSRVRLETPTPRRHHTNDITIDGEESSNLTVGVRVRPLNHREAADPQVTNVVHVSGNEVQVTCDTGAGTTHTFSYDHCFASSNQDSPNYASQESIFTTMVQPLVDKAFQGYNACLFAYGQTGSGKSYSMMGADNECTSGTISSESGIIPRFCHELFERIASLDDSQVKQQVPSDLDLGQSHPTATMEISYFEIYNEKIHDLLGGAAVGGTASGLAEPNPRRPPLKVREHPQYGPYVVDLSVHGVESYKDLQGWLTVGNSQRATAATGMNEKSSRSHSIFSVILTQTHPHGDVGLSRRSKINLVDLAGSERLSQTCASGDRLREGVSINRSLLTLGKVIAALADNTGGRRRGFVPYRESVLTWLLRESLGGNSSTTMLATISPCNSHLEETLATLRYACQARTIVNRVRVNEDPSHRRIRQLLAEIASLREVHEDLERQQRLAKPCKKLSAAWSEPGQEEELREKLRRTEEQLAEAQKSWTERLREAERCKNAEMSLLRRRGVALALDAQQPCPFLVNLAPDPSLSGALLYLLPPGAVRVGRMDGEGASTAAYHSPNPSPAKAAASPARGSPLKGASPPHIQLEGPLVHRHHCTIENRRGCLTLEPGREGLTFVNGRAVTGRTVLRHGDRLVLGGNHYFRVSNPHDKSSNTTGKEPPADYEFAHNEILAVQEAKLRVELDDAKQRAMLELEEAKREAESRLMSQRCDYEKQLRQLGQTLEQHRDALDHERRQKQQLEVQKSVLEAEVNRKNQLKLEPLSPTPVTISPHRSKFIKDLEALLNGSMSALENDATCDSPGTPKKNITHSPGISTSLHELQVQVREASQRCKELGIPYDFQQQHVVRETSLEPVVRIRDRSQKIAVSWSPARFSAWLDRLRDWDSEDSLAELMIGFGGDEEEALWEADEDNETTGDEVDSSICVNILPIRRKLNESLQQSLTESPLSAALQNGMSPARHRLKVKQCLEDMEICVHRLSNLLNENETPQASLCYVDRLKEVLSQLKLSVHHESLSIPRSPHLASTPQNKTVRFFLDPDIVRS